MPVPLERLRVGPWGPGSWRMNWAAPEAFPAFSAAATSLRFRTPMVAITFRVLDRELARTTWVQPPLRTAAWSAEPITALVHLVLVRSTVLVPVLPPSVNRAG